MAQLGLDGNANGVGDLHDLFALCDVLLVGKRGAIDHNGGETSTDSADEVVERAAVVKVHGKRNVRILALVVTSELADFLDAKDTGAAKNHRGIELICSLQRSLDSKAIVDIGSGDSVAALFRFLQKLVHRFHHDRFSLSFLMRIAHVNRIEYVRVSLLDYL